jgi:hypothetical protein
MFFKNLEIILLSNILKRLKSFVGTQHQRYSTNDNTIILCLANKRIKNYAYYI